MPLSCPPLSLHDALPIYPTASRVVAATPAPARDQAVMLKDRSGEMSVASGAVSNVLVPNRAAVSVDRKSTRLNSSHVAISYAVFCVKKKIDTEKRRIDST